jgi:hypothetical protein
MARPRNLTPPLRWANHQQQYCIYICAIVATTPIGIERRSGDRRLFAHIACPGPVAGN